MFLTEYVIIGNIIVLLLRNFLQNSHSSISVPHYSQDIEFLSLTDFNTRDLSE